MTISKDELKWLVNQEQAKVALLETALAKTEAMPALLSALIALRDECSGGPRPTALLGMLADANIAIAKAQAA